MCWDWIHDQDIWDVMGLDIWDMMGPCSGTDIWDMLDFPHDNPKF